MKTRNCWYTVKMPVIKAASIEQDVGMKHRLTETEMRRTELRVEARPPEGAA